MRRTIIAVICLLTGCSSTPDPEVAAPTMVPAPTPAVPAPSLGKGYLPPAVLPDSVALIPPPPPPGSAAQARDDEASKAALKAKDGPRWTLATNDADLFSPDAADTFACAAGIAISEPETPALFRLLRTAGSDLGVSTFAGKKKYMRSRPFLANGQPTCTPEFEERLKNDGSYPSGHSAIGYGWGLILAEIIPERAARLVARGRAFGDSRRFCNVHWLSDVEEGRIVAGATVARLHAEPAFQADLAAAKTEVAKAKAAPSADACAAEAAALTEVR